MSDEKPQFWYHVDRTGLYVMVIIILLNSCDTMDSVERQEGAVDRIEMKLDSILESGGR